MIASFAACWSLWVVLCVAVCVNCWLFGVCGGLAVYGLMFAVCWHMRFAA